MTGLNFLRSYLPKNISSNEHNHCSCSDQNVFLNERKKFFRIAQVSYLCLCKDVAKEIFHVIVREINFSGYKRNKISRAEKKTRVLLK